MKIIGISDIEGFRLGNAENKEKGTGCTVIVCEDGAVGGVDVRGGGPATRETDLLRSENTVNAVNAVVLSGGSAFGLEAASGVMRELADRKIGFDVGEGIVVPIVCGASLFDLAVGDHSAFPDVGMGMQAVRNAYVEGGFSRGNHGAGTGATVGKIKGHDRAMKTGLGTFACGDGFIEVGAITAVNAVGDVYNGAGNIIAGLRSEDGGSIYGTIKTLKSMVHDNTVSVDESTAFIDRADVDQAISFSDTEDKPAGFSDTSNTEDKVISFADLEDEVKDADEVPVYETEEAADPQDPETAAPEAEAATEIFDEQSGSDPEPEPEPAAEAAPEELTEEEHAAEAEPEEQQDTVQEQHHKGSDHKAHIFQDKRCQCHHQHAQEHLGFQESHSVLAEDFQVEIRIALVLSDNFENIVDKADHQQCNDDFGPHIRHQIVRVFQVRLRYLGLQNVREESVPQKHEQEDIADEFKQRISLLFPLHASKVEGGHALPPVVELSSSDYFRSS